MEQAIVQASRRWWGSIDLHDGQTARWRIGALSLHAWRGSDEWRLAFVSGEDPLDDSLSFDVSSGGLPDDKVLTVRRFGYASTSDKLTLTPATADRPVIVEPATPLFLPAGEKATLYVGTLAWLNISAGDAGQAQLADIATHRPSDTWFGASTRFGELCYASRTLARTSISLLTPQPNRLITPIVIENNGVDMLPIHQLRVPATNLSVFCDTNDQLWTDTVIFDRGENDNDAVLRIAPQRSGDIKLISVAEPRCALQPNVVVRAFSKLFG